MAMAQHDVLPREHWGTDRSRGRYPIPRVSFIGIRGLTHLCQYCVITLKRMWLWRTLSVYKWKVIDCQIIRNQEDRYWPLTSGILLGFYINLLLNYRAHFTTETCKQILNYTFMPSRLFSFVCYQLADEALHIGLASVQIQSYVIYIHVTFHV